ncbi:MAG: PAS domain-containing protein [Pseudomonadota bacterium]|nr:PAS domain-containing protein [Pseudomonadota bacterium]
MNSAPSDPNIAPAPESGATAPNSAGTLSATSGGSAADNQSLTRRDDHFYEELARTNNDLANLQREIARKNMELAAAQAALQREHTELRLLLDLMPAMVWFKDTTNGIRRVNQRVADHVHLSVAEIEGKASTEIYPAEAARFYTDDLEVIKSGTPKLGYVESLLGPDGEQRWVQTDKVPHIDETGKVVGIVVMAQDITGRKHADQELEKAQSRLLEVSRQGGMAEVASSVLHNVGNVLNSVNVSANLAVDNIKTSRAASMAKVVALLREHRADLGSYITSDPKGQHIPAFLEQISGDWLRQEQTLIKELESLRDNIDHIKAIVAMQQSYAKVSGASERVRVRDLVEDCLRVKEVALSEHHVRVIREFEEVPAITVEKDKVLQILMNLVRNAKVACDGLDTRNRYMKLGIAMAGDRIRISVGDNGIGIAPENLTRIFSQGFTTRKDGRGIGLHSGALAAAELGGRLSAHSDGPGKGATFTLELPQQPPGVDA